MIKLSGAISPYRQEEREPGIGSGAIPVSMAREIATFLKQDVKIGIQNFLVNSPREILEDTIRNKEWFKGIVLSAAFFEHFVSIMLEKHTNGGIKNKNLKLPLEKLLRLLHDFRLVREPIYSKMQEVRKERNSLVHNPFANADEEKSRKIIENAIKCLEEMGVADEPSQ